MDIQKLSDKKYTAALYLIPFVLMLCACLNFIYYTAYTLPTSNFTVFVAFHLLFLLSLSAICGNLMIELFLALFENSKNSSLHNLLYDGQQVLAHKNLRIRRRFYRWLHRYDEIPASHGLFKTAHVHDSFTCYFYECTPLSVGSRTFY